ncbi:Holliday junction resolvase RuvX [Candidatus Parcubacteria bacterium]|nr:Holliday junction resolvase RuvX [Candidatus Parcubacteria bacterium]
MNYLAIDYGTKRIGTAISIMGVISPLKTFPNNTVFFNSLEKITNQNEIKKIFVGICQGSFAVQTKSFVAKLKLMLKLPVELVEESVSTIEADELYKQLNKKRYRSYRKAQRSGSS